MGLLKETDLHYKDYSDTVFGGDDPEISGKPDSTLFNRKEKYEVLYMINKIAKKHDFLKINSGFKIERMLHEHLPGSVRKQIEVVAWVEKEWRNY
ncbi:MAG: hypothetical protein KAI81_00450 [Candidatus Marinimicrobia bacterium]|nr:hypothetical protein [Candidatus Neomarinimicrobiota bacterium]